MWFFIDRRQENVDIIIEKEAKEIIDKNISDFIESIKYIVNNNHYNKDYFSVLYSDSKYYDYVNLHEMLKTRIIDFLIFGVIDDFLTYKEVRHEYASSNVPGRLIIIYEESLKKGYTLAQFNHYKEYINKAKELNLKRIATIVLDKNNKHPWDKILKNHLISLDEFMGKYFNDNELKYYKQRVKKAIDDAHTIIGYKVIDINQSKKATKFRMQLQDDLKEKASEFSTWEYKKLSEGVKIDNKKNIVFSQEVLEMINKYFYEKGLYKALSGYSHFANSFVTAEFLFEEIKGDYQFDYTSVISGYFKSIELLLRTIILDIYCKDDFYISGLRISKKKEKYSRVELAEKNINKMKTDLGSYCYFIKENGDKILRVPGISNEVFKMLTQYSDECRNKITHERNIYDVEEVLIVRNNTYYIMAILLGLCKLSECFEKNYEILGITDYEFDKFVNAIFDLPPKSSVLLEYDHENIMVVRPYKQRFPEVDEPERKLKFIRFDSEIDETMYKIIINNPFDKREVPKGKEFIVDESNIPNTVKFGSIIIFVGKRKRLRS